MAKTKPIRPYKPLTKKVLVIGITTMTELREKFLAELRKNGMHQDLSKQKENTQGCWEPAFELLQGKEARITGTIDPWTGMYIEVFEIISAETKEVLYQRDYGTIPYEMETYLEDYKHFLVTGEAINH